MYAAGYGGGNRALDEVTKRMLRVIGGRD